MVKSFKLKIKNQEFEFNGKEISKLNQDIKDNIIKNYYDLEDKPFIEIQRNNVKFKVLYSPDRIEFWKKFEVNKWKMRQFKYLRNTLHRNCFVDIGA